jgi:hypothetical protein
VNCGAVAGDDVHAVVHGPPWPRLPTRRFVGETIVNLARTAQLTLHQLIERAESMPTNEIMPLHRNTCKRETGYLYPGNK